MGVNLYFYDGMESVNIIVMRSDSDTSSDGWSVNAQISTPWATDQDCSSTTIHGGTERYALIQCPAIIMQKIEACGSNVDIEIRLSSDRYSGTSSSARNCAGTSLGETLTLTAPMECPTCPIPSSYQPCDMPSAKTCSYTTTGYGGGTVSLPCYCSFRSTTGERVWSCAVS